MATIYISIPASQTSGGPSVWAYKIQYSLNNLGHKVIFDKPQRSDIAIAVISVGKLLKQVNRSKTKVILRCDGIYNKLYNEKFNRALRPDMVSLHNDLKTNIPLVDHVCYQSSWSYYRISDEIVKRNNNYSIIPNGSDVNIFKPIKKIDDGYLKLISVGKMRDAYYMETLIKTYKEVKKNNNKTKLLLVGSMDAACIGIYKQFSQDKDIIIVGSFPNSKLNNAYNMGDIFLDVRQGSSSNNTVSEAQAAGLPVVCPSWSGSTDMVIDNVSGKIVDGGKWDYNETYFKNLAHGVEIIAQDLSKYSDAARQNAVDNLSLETMVKKYLKSMGL